MIGHELTIQQFKAPRFQTGRQPDKGDFRSVRLPAEHAFTEKSASQRDAVQATHQPFFHPALDTMGISHRIKGKACFLDGLVDPAFRAFRCRFGTSAEHPCEVAVSSDIKFVGTKRFAQRFGDVHRLQRQDGPLLGLYPKNFGIVPAVRHGKYPHSIGPQQDI